MNQGSDKSNSVWGRARRGVTATWGSLELNTHIARFGSASDEREGLPLPLPLLTCLAIVIVMLLVALFLKLGI